MENYETHLLKAKKLMEDDYLQIGGQMYRITNLSKDKRITITVYPINENVDNYIILIVGKRTLFKVYNQKY